MAQKRENPYISILLNVVIPTIILVRFSGDSMLGPETGLLFALTFPFTYGLYDFTQTAKINFFSAIGLVSTILTGGIGLMELDPKYVAIKEAGVPLLIGIVVLASVKTKYPIIKTFIEKIIQMKKIHERLDAHGTRDEFNRRMRIANHWFAASFLLSAILNFALAKMVVVSAPGTEAFNSELGRMLALSYPVIALPTTIMMAIVMYSVISGISKLTKLEFEEFLLTK